MTEATHKGIMIPEPSGVSYEWDCETVAVAEFSDKHADYEVGDVIDHYHANNLAELLRFVEEETPPANQGYELVLVRDDDKGRSWAYMEGGKLPENFEDADGRYAAKVPKRFHQEVERNSKLR